MAPQNIRSFEATAQLDHERIQRDVFPFDAALKLWETQCDLESAVNFCECSNDVTSANQHCQVRWKEDFTLYEESNGEGEVVWQEYCHVVENRDHQVCLSMDAESPKNKIKEHDYDCQASWNGSDCHSCRLTECAHEGHIVPGLEAQCSWPQHSAIVKLCFPSPTNFPVWNVRFLQKNDSTKALNDPITLLTVLVSLIAVNLFMRMRQSRNRNAKNPRQRRFINLYGEPLWENLEGFNEDSFYYQMVNLNQEASEGQNTQQ